MRIEKLRTNHIECPLGYLTDKLVFSWIVSEAEGQYQKSARVRIGTEEQMNHLVYDSGEREDISSLGFEVPFITQPCTRYYWDVSVTDEKGNMGISEVTWFETAKGEEGILGQWIGSPFHQNLHPAFQKNFYLKKPIKSARFYGTALGLFECFVNGTKTGDEYLAPFYTDYNNWLQYVTYDITEQLQVGENAVGIILGNGWYKGRFGDVAGIDQLYGNRFQLLAELRIVYEDGTVEQIGTDTGWKCCPCEITQSSIYDGEAIDARRKIPGFSTIHYDMPIFQFAVSETGTKAMITPRLSPALRVMEIRKPVQLLRTPKDELVLDFGQVMTGWVEADVNLPKGCEFYLQYGELLQEGCFYNENLRSAKQEFRFISDGTPAHVRPHFTFYGFRYVKVTGVDSVQLDDFVACVLYSEIEEIGFIETSNEKVNQLISNTKWGQKGNFVDIPSDCPQRDERFGWTGDAQVFCATASFHMYTPAFYRKYMYDMALEQKHLGGAVPYVVPDALNQAYRILGVPENMYGACGWGDVSTIIPWTMYLFYGDKTLLEQQYENMTGWVNFIRNQDVEYAEGKYLWRSGYHYGDWLALDNPQGGCRGATDEYYLASAYYYYSTKLTAKVAEILGKESDAIYYQELSQKICEAIQKEYFAEDGTLKIDTQTAHVLALYFGFAPKTSRKQLVLRLKQKLDARNIHLDTGFLGTPYLCRTLAQEGLIDYAYTLLLNEDYPSWLYEVNMGATTVWERWNSVMPDGLVSDTGMNSMNHYSFGAVAEWIYRGICGLNPLLRKPGFKKVKIAPQIDGRLDWAKVVYNSASGQYISGWKLEGNQCRVDIQIPFDASAEFEVPDGYELVSIKGKDVQNADVRAVSSIRLAAGSYEILLKVHRSEHETIQKLAK